eukprot:3515652-Rhodomonas_salina.1
MGSGTPDQLDQIAKALEGLNKRFVTLDVRFDTLNASVSQRFDALYTSVNERFDALNTSQQ